MCDDRSLKVARCIALNEIAKLFYSNVPMVVEMKNLESIVNFESTVFIVAIYIILNM